jgi:hypothetical protein
MTASQFQSASVDVRPALKAKSVFMLFVFLLFASLAWSQDGTLTACQGMSLGNESNLNGFVPFPATDNWNTNIASAPVDPNSAAYVANDFAGMSLHPNYGFGYAVVDSTQGAPLVPIYVFDTASNSDVTLAPFPATANAESQPGLAEAALTNCAGWPDTYLGDNHGLVLDRATCWLYETYDTHVCNGLYGTSGEVIWDMLNSEQRPWGWTSVDAAGLSVFAGLIRYDEVVAGAIHHAIRITMDQTKKDAHLGYFVIPATHAAGNTPGSDNVEGERIRLKASFDISSYAANDQVILTALKNYGMIIADNGGNFFLQGTYDSRWSDADYNDVKSVSASNFEVVQSTPEFPGWDETTAPQAYSTSPTEPYPIPTINSFTATATSVSPGTPVTFNYSVTGDSYDYIDMIGPVRLTSGSGSVTITPTATQTYTLYSINAYSQNFQAVSTPITVTVAGSVVTPPIFSPPAGTYAAPPTVTITTPTYPWATIYYTTDGTTPTTNSTHYTGDIGTMLQASGVQPATGILLQNAENSGSGWIPITETPETIEAIAIAPGYDTPSAVSSATYGITNIAAAPTFSPGTGSYSSANPPQVTISDTAPGVPIYYTIDGSTPTTASEVYSSPIVVSTSETVKAIAAGNGYLQGPVGSATYTIVLTAATPTFSLAPGNYSASEPEVISDATSGATIYYTTDGSTPTTASTVYSGSFVVYATSETVNAIAVATGYANSAVASATYVIGLSQAATPTISPAEGTYSTAQTVVIGDSTAGATVYYTTDGSTPTTASTVYSAPFTLWASAIVNAFAGGPSYTQSGVASVAYVINPPAAACPTGSGSCFDNFTGAAGEELHAYNPNWLNLFEGNTVIDTNGFNEATLAKTTGWNTYGYAASTSDYSEITVPTSSGTNHNSKMPCIRTGTYCVGFYSGTSGMYTAVSVYNTINGNMGNSGFASGSSAFPTTVTHTLGILAVGVNTLSSVSYYVDGIYQGNYGIGDSTAIVPEPGFEERADGILTDAVITHWQDYPSNPSAATPTFSPVAGTYTSIQSVSISDATSGASIYYTTDGSTPTVASTKFTGTKITVSSSQTLNAIAVATGYANSAIASAVYAINTPTPTFSPAAGTYYVPQTVTISDSGATIYYTTNGMTPTTSSTPYTGAITVSASETIQAIAVETGSGFGNSAVATAAYAINAATPTLSLAAGTYSTAQTVTISDTTSGALIFYTTDGTAPTTSSTIYSVPITVSASEKLQAVAVLTGYGNSAVASAAYTIQVATPTFSPAAGSYTSAPTVTISDATSGSGTSPVTIYYTTNGSTPTTASTVYSGPITVTPPETLEAIAVAAGCTNSAVASAAYTVPIVATPTFSPAAGNYYTAQTVTISDTTSGATIYYTTNGSTPTTSSTVYSGPIAVSASEAVNAIAVDAGYTTSAIGTGAYVIKVATPTLSLATGSYTSAQTLTISDTTSGAAIYYTTNGSTPTTSSTVYSVPITVSTTETLNAIAVAAGYTNSSVASAIYTFPAATPTFSPAAGNYYTVQTVTISDTTSGATIYYTTNGTLPTTASTVYSGPIAVSGSETLYAIAAAATGLANSAVASATYTIGLQTAMPFFSPAAGTYSTAQTVVIASTTPSATIYYTTNGTTPTINSTVYSGPVTVSSTQTLTAIALASGYVQSPVASAAYTFVTLINAPIYVQQCSQTASATTLTCPLTGVGAGHTLIIGVTSTNTLSSVTSSSGTPVVVDAVNLAVPGPKYMNVYYLPNTTAGNITITVNQSGSAAILGVSAFEYSNTPLTSPLDGTYGVSLSSYSTPLSTGNITTTVQSDLLWTYCATTSNTLAIGTVPITWTQRLLQVPPGSAF